MFFKSFAIADEVTLNMQMGKRERSQTPNGKLITSCTTARQSLIRSVLICLIFLISNVSVFAQQGPFCGIYAVYAAAIELRHTNNVPFEALISKEFVSSTSGSTDTDICSAAEYLGLTANRHDGLSVASLNFAGNCWILHTTSHGQLKIKNHWQLVFRVNGAKAEIFDVKNGRMVVDTADLVSGWDGVAIQISACDSGLTRVTPRFVEAFTHLGLFFIFFAISSGIFRFFSKRQGIVAIGMGYAAIVTGIFVQAYVSASLTPAAFSRISNEFIDFDIAELSGAEVAKMVLAGDVQALIVDTRYAHDHVYSPVSGSFSLPIDCDTREIDTFLAVHAAGRPLICFCQSRTCKFARLQAERLMRNGAKNVYVFSGGRSEIAKIINECNRSN